MKVLFSATPAFGHILPMASLMECALAAGHSVALVTSAGIQADIVAELDPAVTFLPAGVMPAVFSGEAARRTGADVFHPTPAVIGEIFGGARVDLSLRDTIARARDWAPDVVIAEAFDAVGPMVAADLGIAWHRVGVGPAVPSAISDAIDRASSLRYRQTGLKPVSSSSYIDPCPASMQDPDWSSEVPVRPMRVRAHRRSRPAEFGRPAFADPSRPTALLTLGTIFSDPELLAAIVEAVSENAMNVIATVGSSMRFPAGAPGASPALGCETPSGKVGYVPFVPLDQLLDGADLVIGSGGAGTVLAALAKGVPMVLWPQGAEQPLNAARAAASGAAIVVDRVEQVAGAAARALADPSYGRRAAQAAAQIVARPGPAEVIAAIVAE